MGQHVEPKQYSRQYVVVFAGEANRLALCAALSLPYVCVRNRAEFVAATTKKRELAAVAFVDTDLLFQLKLNGDVPTIPIVGIIDDAQAETLSHSVRVLDSFPWLSHILIASILSTSQAAPHLTMLLDRLAFGLEHDMLNAHGVGRVALLASASKRVARFDRMNEFFGNHGLSTRSLTTISEVAEELVMNALYDAPTEAGYFATPVPRTQDVSLPTDRACEISYGIEGGNIFVRVRDPFGALTRRRLLDVLNRCNSRSVQLDESRGGAGLGLWRVFSTASTIVITVVPGRITDILIGLTSTGGRIAKHLDAVHMFFSPDTNGSLDSLMPDLDDGLIDQSITLTLIS